MENKNNQPIDNFFDETEQSSPSEERKDEPNSSNYFNDYKGGEKAQVNGENEKSGYGDEQVENGQKNQGQPFSNGDVNQTGANGYFNNVQNGVAYDRTNGAQGGGLLKDEQKYSALGVVSMVLGIVSIVSCCLAGASVVLAIIALILSIMRMSVKADGFAIAGLVTGILGFLVNVLFLIAIIAGADEQSTAVALCALSQTLSNFGV